MFKYKHNNNKDQRQWIGGGGFPLEPRKDFRRRKIEEIERLAPYTISFHPNEALPINPSKSVLVSHEEANE